MIPRNASDSSYDFYLSVIDDPNYWLTLTVVGYNFSTVIILTNAFLLFTIYQDPRKSLRSPSSLLIANLTASDLLMGLGVLLVAVRDTYRYEQLHMPYVGIIKVVIYIIYFTSVFISGYTIIAMSIAYYIAIKKPREYKIIITVKRVKIFIVGVWVIALATCFLPITSIPQNIYELIYAHTLASLPAVLLTLIYVNVFRALARQSRDLPLSGSDSIVRNRRVLEGQRKMTLTIIIILGLFFMTYMPQYIAVHLLRLSCKSCRKSINFYKVDVAASRFLCLSSVMNPFVYAWRVSRYRSALFECLRIIRKKLKHSSRMNDGVTVYGEQTRLETFCESHENLVRKFGKVRVVDQTSV